MSHDYEQDLARCDERTQKAAVALASNAEAEAKYYAAEAEVALAAADAHDKANGIHRVSLDQLTRAMYEVDPLKFHGDEEPVPWESLGPAWRLFARDKAKAVLAAAVKEVAE